MKKSEVTYQKYLVTLNIFLIFFSLYVFSLVYIYFFQICGEQNIT